MIEIYLFLIAVAVILSMYRFFRGPTTADRIVAVDIMTTLTTGLMVLFALHYRRAIFLDVALVYAVLAFVGVIAFARYMEGGL
ncbi:MULTISPECIES: monovalent cation/H+ antiporter complex subunit F [Thermococcus]|uniref:Membrane-bound NADP+-reducing complex MBX, subunit MbxB (Na+/H+ transporter subunit) n=2 Tax=Thermococcus sibiricus TaxID=172049 RepID=C5ZZY4_THESM|nr:MULTISPECIES: monovalent cation/H+ antiporter complex subunit F [Thermococcus]KUK29184.1 MAG: Membrane-bound NADP+-reducing complex MBX, subunit MbxB (Na+/H+ transporter subunit) [Thermococcus sp. 40_45]HII67003.1 cation:proton antiporter [Thermococcaceae archaeon]ACS90965.1 Membrane-bound NADP+-reducing complex MBX, subunit MbxB (Na+/H+ transporter subunit) [Thermococcus sibiricus MM 739]KUK17194.1 MAG: Membrane-bound NADP+-reducing complex MBX, subunit MbxB (Na+/H+ transporter subunit) [Th